MYFGRAQDDMDNINKFKDMILRRSGDKVACQVYTLSEPDPEKIETFMNKRVTNFKINKNNPLIVETFQ